MPNETETGRNRTERDNSLSHRGFARKSTEIDGNRHGPLLASQHCARWPYRQSDYPDKAEAARRSLVQSDRVTPRKPQHSTAWRSAGTGGSHPDSVVGQQSTLGYTFAARGRRRAPPAGPLVEISSRFLTSGPRVSSLRATRIQRPAVTPH